ncbi:MULTISPECIES: sodium/glutamate symporter [Fusobacterium]|jgi:ESS family glutamate:Na+ symporter|uniref:Sodium/glutamate symporter n=2 Tax=Fusobacterium ulcerans TaxID=861 RepID=A0AAX1TSV7_9FUSO|nr:MULTISPECIES: sodium/glutamate symporter [Fusobacterium]AVQ27152.1 sodium/glutamate symporter [Fusobacterium ulcerans]EFS24719.1 sodium/glutamate symporter [Fusobacterium ulcerans ATCC 49185]EHO83000.1 sodium/glutamate symporter [Fusobacterium ulcerans 12-1B]MCB8564340.1 sodium/glutamate symporter [Fusobacterium ulcerans]MCB8648072.1 sodium/glutamate symporter [Fusobacterium ulcerans]
MVIDLNLFLTTALAVIVLLVGDFVKKRVEILRKFCIPIPVIGGLIFTILVSIGYSTQLFTFKLNFALSDVFMLAFYSSIGFTASYKLLKKGGPKVIKFLIVSIIVVILQNFLGVYLAKLLGLSPLVGLATASIPMTGGHGTSAAFAPVLEEAGLQNALTITLAAATFGLVAGSLIGGPTGKFLIEKYKLITGKETEKVEGIEKVEKGNEKLDEKRIYSAVYQLLVSMALGSIISMLLKKTGLTFPASVGAMIAAAIVRNIADYSTWLKIKETEIRIIGDISLILFLAFSMMSLKLWQLTDLAIPMIILLIAQTILMGLCAVFLTYKVMGKNYEAAMMAVGHCGFGLGAVPTAMANMQSVEEKYGPAPTAFFILPLVGSLFINFFNSAIIVAFINIYK